MSDRTAILVKFPADTLDLVEAFAKSENLNRMAAILALVKDGLAANAPHVVKGKPSPARPAGLATPPPRAQAGPAVKPKMDTSSVGVLDSAARRKAYLAQQGKGRSPK